MATLNLDALFDTYSKGETKLVKSSSEAVAARIIASSNWASGKLGSSKVSTTVLFGGLIVLKGLVVSKLGLGRVGWGVLVLVNISAFT